MFPCSLIHVPKKCCDQPAHEPPLKETAKPSNSLKIPLQGRVMFPSISFAVKKGL